MLIDEVVIKVKAGDGGNGAVSLRHEKYIDKGGPDGGDGGDGASVFLRSTNSTHGLGQFRGKKDYRAEEGEKGGKNKLHGKNGEPLVLTVPPGTKITEIRHDGAEYLIADMTEEGQEIRVARGGKGGRGNWHFRSATNQTPMSAEPGTPGQAKTLKLELILLADVGLVGLPNAGKSTFLASVSNAKPKIADYPFTTLQPHLGMVKYYDDEFVVADIPGLIAGAAEGRGLGIEFLKHIQRTTSILHIVAATEEDPEAVYETVRGELKQFDPRMLDKNEIVVLSKIDLVPDWEKTHKAFIKKHKALGMSAATGEGVQEVLKTLAAQLTR